MKRFGFALLTAVLLLPAFSVYAASPLRVYAPTPCPTATVTVQAPQATATPLSAFSENPLVSPTPSPTPTVTPSPAPTAVSTPSPSPTATPSPTPMPKVIDLVNQPTAEWPFTQDEPLLEIWIPKIRDADAALIRCGDAVVAIDCADEPQADRLAALAQAYTGGRIDTLFITHPHHDHIGGLSVLADSVKIKRMIVSFPMDFNEHMYNGMIAAGQHGIGAYTMFDGDEFSIGDARLTVLCKVDASRSVNDRSAVMNLTYGSCSMLWMADTTVSVQNILLETVPVSLLNVDIIKAPHHGLTNFRTAFLKAASPQLAVITNIMRVPETASTLRSNGVALVYTHLQVTHLATDGTHWAVEQLDPDNLPDNPFRTGNPFLVTEDD